MSVAFVFAALLVGGLAVIGLALLVMLVLLLVRSSPAKASS